MIKSVKPLKIQVEKVVIGIFFYYLGSFEALFETLQILGDNLDKGGRGGMWFNYDIPAILFWVLLP